MAKVVDYEYIVEVSTADALKQAASDVSSGYNGEIPGVNTFKINAGTSIYNESGGDGLGIAGWDTTVQRTPAVGSISWSSGDINLPDGTVITVSSGSANVSSPTYIYCDTTDGTVYSTTTAIDAVGENKIMICAAFPNSGKYVTYKAFGSAYQNQISNANNIANGSISGSLIAANTITANNIASGTITADQIASSTITANEIAGNTITASEIASGAITSSKIQSGAVTASKIDVSTLSAITANLGDVYVGTSSDSEIRIYTSGSQGRIYFSYEGSTVGYMIGDYISGVGDTVAITGGSSGSGNIALNGKVWCLNRLRIPVGDNLY